MSKTIYREISSSLKELEQNPGLVKAKAVIDNIISILGINGGEWIPFNDSRRKIFNRADWFHMAHGFNDRRATYKIVSKNNKNIDLKAYWVRPKRKYILHWVVALTPNFEDEPYNGKFNIGIDFVVPDKADRIQVILSNRRVLRVLELQGKLTPTQQAILFKWENLNFSDKKELHNSLWNSFDLNEINKEFYKQLFEHFSSLRDFLCENIKFEERDASIFVIRLIGRIMFCWFLDKRGFIKNSEYYFSVDNGQSDKEYYNKKLRHLFFKILDTQEKDRADKDKKTAPYLNGGLFEKRSSEIFSEFDNLDFPENFFNNFFSFLKRYNFTTDESMSSFQQVAIDPEMLGKIFENLLAELHEETKQQARKAKGAYYTPREVVDYMCKESLRSWLKSQLPNNDDVKECLEKLLDVDWHLFGDQKKNYIRDHIKRYKEDILTALQDVKILDPACGSGAFPIGMLHAIMDLHERINANGMAKKKLEIIKNNIYGIDVDPMAIEIAKLRAWLTLIIDKSNSVKAPIVLPNLNFKFVCANSLIGFGEKNKTTIKALQEIGEDRKSYFETGNANKKKKMQHLIASTMRTLSISKNYFDPFKNTISCNFFDQEIMFGVKDGFDIVIGNPPYIQLQKNGGELGRLYKDAGYETFARTGDIYQLFYEKGCQLLTQQGGLLAYITSNSWLKAEYGKKTRRWFAQRYTPLRLLEMSKDVFENAIVDTNILIVRSGKSDEVCKAVDMDRLPDKTFPPPENLWGQLRLQSERPWSVLSAIEQNIMDKMETAGTPLKEWDVTINRGVTTGYNNAFIIDDATKQALVAEDPKSSEIIKPVLRGRDIQRYQAKWAGLWLISTFPSLQLDIDDYPAVKKHLLSFGQNRLEQCGKKLPAGGRSRKKTQHLWFEAQDSIAYHEDFEKEKLVWITLVENGRFAYDDNGMYCLDSSFMMTGKCIKYLCGVLNAKLIRWFLQQIAPTSGMGTFQWKKVYLETIPIPQIPAAKQRPFVRLVDSILQAKASDPSADITESEAEIDRLVYELYGLTQEEIATLT